MWRNLLSLVLLQLHSALPLKTPELKFQLHVVQTSATILSCGGSINSPKKLPNSSFLRNIITNVTYPLITGHPPYLELIDNQPPTSSLNYNYYVIFSESSLCEHFHLLDYVVKSNDPTELTLELSLDIDMPPIVQIFVVKNNQFANTKARLKQHPLPPSSSAKTLNAGARAAWSNIVNLTGAEDLLSKKLTGIHQNYGLNNITNILNLVQTQMNHEQSKNRNSKDTADTIPLDHSSTSSQTTAEPSSAFHRENPFTHSAMYGSTKSVDGSNNNNNNNNNEVTNEPCVSVTLEFINCVKRHARVEDCSKKKQRLMDCRTKLGVGNPTSAQNKNLGASQHHPSDFSFRSCSGVSGGCPASGGTPKGAVAKELGIPARPPVYSPTPLGPDLSDAGGTLMMSVIELCLGTAINTLIKKFALYSRKKVNPMLQLSLIDGIPSFGNMESEAVEPGTMTSKPSSGDKPQGNLKTFKPGAVPAAVQAAMAMMGNIRPKPKKVGGANGAGQPTLGMGPKPDVAAGAPKPSLAAAAADGAAVAKAALDTAKKDLAKAEVAAEVTKEQAAKDVSTAKIASSKASSGGGGGGPAAEAKAAVLAGKAESSAVAAAQAADMAADASKANAVAASNYAKAEAEERKLKKKDDDNAGGIGGNGSGPKANNGELPAGAAGAAGAAAAGAAGGAGRAGGAAAAAGSMPTSAPGLGVPNKNIGVGADILKESGKDQEKKNAKNIPAPQIGGLDGGAAQSGAGSNIGDSMLPSNKVQGANSKIAEVQKEGSGSNTNSDDKKAAGEDVKTNRDALAKSKKNLATALTASEIASQQAEHAAAAAKDAADIADEPVSSDAGGDKNKNRVADRGKSVALSMMASDSAIAAEKAKIRVKDASAKNKDAANNYAKSLSRLHHLQALHTKKNSTNATSNTYTNSNLDYSNAVRASTIPIKAINAADAALKFDHQTEVQDEAKISTDEARKQNDDVELKRSTHVENTNKELAKMDKEIAHAEPNYDDSRNKLSHTNQPTSGQPSGPARYHDNEKGSRNDNTKSSKSKPGEEEEAHSGDNSGDEDHGRPGVQALKTAMSRASLLFLQLDEHVHTNTFKKAPKKGLGALTKIITGELLHVLTGVLTRLITDDFTEQMTPVITSAVSNAQRDETINYLVSNVGKMLETTLTRTLKVTVPTSLNTLLPSQLLKSLTGTLEKTIVRSLVHTVAPTITYVLAPPKNPPVSYSQNTWYYEAYYSDFVLQNTKKKK